MRLLWPGLLPLFLLVPILILLYWWILRAAGGSPCGIPACP